MGQDIYFLFIYIYSMIIFIYVFIERTPGLQPLGPLKGKTQDQTGSYDFNPKSIFGNSVPIEFVNIDFNWHLNENTI